MGGHNFSQLAPVNAVRSAYILLHRAQVASLYPSMITGSEKRVLHTLVNTASVIGVRGRSLRCATRVLSRRDPVKSNRRCYRSEHRARPAWVRSGPFGRHRVQVYVFNVAPSSAS